jgi:hypothetical protein
MTDCSPEARDGRISFMSPLFHTFGKPSVGLTPYVEDMSPLADGRARLDQ